MKVSTTMTAQEAIEEISKMKNPEEISAFIENEDRKTVINAADERRKALTPSSKDGEVKGPITRDTQDFKDGVQKTKDADPKSRVPSSRSYVTCDDVIKKMRAEGKKI
jgi:hypothetical protein